jgi:hypothetical protein
MRGNGEVAAPNTVDRFFFRISRVWRPDSNFPGLGRLPEAGTLPWLYYRNCYKLAI